jgi:hypothetical protein
MHLRILSLVILIIAGVANIGSEKNWTGHLYCQANWYACGRLAWQPSRRQFPEGIEKPQHDLEHYIGLKSYFVPGH